MSHDSRRREQEKDNEEQTFEDYYADRERADLLRPMVAKIKEWIEEEKKTTHSTYGLPEVIVAYRKVLNLLEGKE